MRFDALRISLACIIVPTFSFAQTGANNKTPNAPAPSLSKAVDMGNAEYRMYEDDPRKVRFKLVTSWIPGEKHQGMFRYQLNARVDKPKPDVEPNFGTDIGPDIGPDESVEKLLKRVSRCTITLELYDSGGFVLRRHSVHFIRAVDAEHARLTSLYANDTFQLNAQEYRQLINSGSWNILWSCE